MDTEEKNTERQNSFNGKEKNVSVSEYTDNMSVYNVEMTVTQANAISRLLPKSYSIHVDRNIKQKRAIKRTFTVDCNSK